MSQFKWKNAIKPLAKYIRRNTNSTTSVQDTSISTIRLSIRISDGQTADIQRIKQLVLLHAAIAPAHMVEIREINNGERKIEVDAISISKNLPGLTERIRSSFSEKE